jgi:hypothetical protein
MRRLLQISTTLVISLLALQPALEGLACSMLMGPVACPMSIKAMSPDCAMAQPMAQAGCAQDCCNHALPQSAVITAVPAKSRSAAPAQLTLAGAEPLQPQTASVVRNATAASVSPPPLYLLNRVFRI